MEFELHISILISTIINIVDECMYQLNLTKCTWRTRAVGKSLNHFASWIRPPKNVKDEGRQLGHQMLSWLQQCDNRSVRPDRFRFGGGFRKDTSTILKFDIDIVFFISQPVEIHRLVLDEWKKVLIEKTCLSESDIRGNIALSFDYQGFAIDICAGQNFSPSSLGDQTAGAISYTLDVPEADRYQLSPSFSEAAVDFVRRQSQRTKDVCRLAKFWQQGIPCFQSIDGRSLIFECIAIFASKKFSMKDNDVFIFCAFKRFLDLVSNWEKLLVTFPEDANRLGNFTPTDRRLRPAIYLPYDSTTNIMQGMDEEAIATFKQHAVESMKKLDSIMLTSGMDVVNVLFSPKTKSMRLPYGSIRNLQFSIDCQCQSWFDRLPEIYFNCKRTENDFVQRRLAKQFLKMAAANVAMSCYTGRSEKEVTSNLMGFLNYFGNVREKSQPSVSDHAVRFRIPLQPKPFSEVTAGRAGVITVTYEDGTPTLFYTCLGLLVFLLLRWLFGIQNNT